MEEKEIKYYHQMPELKELHGYRKAKKVDNFFNMVEELKIKYPQYIEYLELEIAIFYGYMNDFVTFQKCIDELINSVNHDEKIYETILVEAGRSYYYKHKFDKAMIYLEEGIELFNNQDCVEILCGIYENNRNIKDYDKGIELVEKYLPYGSIKNHSVLMCSRAIFKSKKANIIRDKTKHVELINSAIDDYLMAISEKKVINNLELCGFISLISDLTTNNEITNEYALSLLNKITLQEIKTDNLDITSFKSIIINICQIIDVDSLNKKTIINQLDNITDYAFIEKYQNIACPNIRSVSLNKEYYELGFAYKKLKSYHLAKKAFERAGDGNKKYFKDSLIELANIATDEKNYELLQYYCEQLINVPGCEEFVYSKLLVINSHTKHYDNVIKYAEKLIELNNKKLIELNNSGKPEHVIMREISTIQKDSNISFCNLCNAYLNLKKYDEAKKYLDLINPISNYDYNYIIVYSLTYYLSIHDYKSGIEFYNNFNSHGITITRGIYELLAEIYIAGNMYDEAKEIYITSQKDDSTKISLIYYFNALIRYQAFDEACKFYENIIEDYYKLYVVIENIKLGRYEEALNAINFINNRYIDESKLINLYICIYSKLKNLDKAREYYQKLIYDEKTSDSVGDYVCLLVNNNMYKEALSVYEKAIELAKAKKYLDDIPKYYYFHMKMLIALERYEEALNDINHYLEYPNPVMENINYELGIIYSKLNDISKAKYHFEELLNTPNETRGLLRLGNIECKLGNYKEALKYYQRLVDQNVQNTRECIFAYNSLITIAYQLNDNEMAKKYYYKYIKDNVYNSDFASLAIIETNICMYEKAIEHYQKDYTLHPQNKKNDLLSIAEIYIIQNKQEVANDILQELMIEYPEDIDVLMKLVKLYSTIQNYNEAINIIEKVMEINPTDINNKTYKAQIYFDMHRYNDTLNTIDEVLKIDPNNNYDAYNLKIKTLFITNKYEEIKEVLNIIENKFPYNIYQIYYYYAVVYFNMGMYKITDRYLDKLIGNQFYGYALNKLIKDAIKDNNLEIATYYLNIMEQNCCELKEDVYFYQNQIRIHNNYSDTEAAENLKHLLNINNNQKVISELANYYYNINEFEESLYYINNIVKKTNVSAYQKIRCLYTLNRKEEAYELMEKVQTNMTLFDGLYEEFFEIFLRENQFQKIINYYEENNLIELQNYCIDYIYKIAKYNLNMVDNYNMIDNYIKYNEDTIKNSIKCNLENEKYLNFDFDKLYNIVEEKIKNATGSIRFIYDIYYIDLGFDITDTNGNVYNHANVYTYYNTKDITNIKIGVNDLTMSVDNTNRLCLKESKNKL